MASVADISVLGSVDKALKALQRLCEAGTDGLALTRLAADLRLNKASLHRTLSTLKHRGFVEQNSYGYYRIGIAFLALADSYLRDESLCRIFHGRLLDLCTCVDETCHLGILLGEQIVYIDKVEPLRSRRILSEIGWRRPAVSTALGRAILSQKFVDFNSFSTSFQTPIVKRSDYTRDSLHMVWQELLNIRKCGYAFEEQESEAEISCVSVAILRGTDPLAAVSVTAPSYRLDAKRAISISHILRDTIGRCLPPVLTLQRPTLSMPAHTDVPCKLHTRARYSAP